ncbi:sulfatase, partial [bacterium]|nr:sulfatase [bacterium]
MTSPKQPNIVFILMDDMGWTDLSCYGSPFYETPNIDQLLADGIQFTNAYAACPVCSPTRASIMSGKYPANVGVTNFIGGHTRGLLIDAPYIDHLPATEKSLAKALNQGGYQTWHVGKWHLGGAPFLPENHGFDINIGGCSWGMPHNGYFSPWNIKTLPNGPDGEYLTDRLTDETIHLIENRTEQPFFLNLCYYSVHVPIQAKPELIIKYQKKALEMGLDRLPTFEDGEYFPCEHKRTQRVRRRLLHSDPAYAAMIETVDQNIGRLMQALEATGETDNTIVIFTSDNGGLATAEGSPTCNAPLAEGKGWMYEGGVREPLIVRWPEKIRPGSVCTTPVTSPDFYPTFLEAAGLELLPEQHSDGISLIPLLLETGSLSRKSLFWHYPHYGNQGGTPGCSIRKGDYKLIEFFEDNQLELYDLKKDVSEKHNLANERPALATELHQKLVNWRESMHAIIPEPNLEWN